MSLSSIIKSNATPPPAAAGTIVKVEGQPTFVAMSATQLRDDNPKYRTALIEGLLRIGEVCNIIAAPKTGKSWLVLFLAVALANGIEWLGFACTQCRVLLVDAELHTETLGRRIDAVAGNADISGITICARRGKPNALNIIADAVINEAKNCNAGVIIFDALYRFWPSGMAENDNAGMTEVYNILDRIAAEAGAAVVVVHHTSKGNQSEKNVTDGGSGAGALSRAADTHVLLRKHSDDGKVSVDCVTRSFAQAEAFVIALDGHRWIRDASADPSMLAGVNGKGCDRVEDEKFLSFLRSEHEGRKTIAARIESAGLKLPIAKIEGRLELLKAEGKVYSSRGPRGVALYGLRPADDTDVTTRIRDAAARLPEASDEALAVEVGCTARFIRKWRADNA
jgi:hypothetical protein